MTAECRRDERKGPADVSANAVVDLDAYRTAVMLERFPWLTRTQLDVLIRERAGVADVERFLEQRVWSLTEVRQQDLFGSVGYYEGFADFERFHARRHNAPCAVASLRPATAAFAADPPANRLPGDPSRQWR